MSIDPFLFNNLTPVTLEGTGLFITPTFEFCDRTPITYLIWPSDNMTRHLTSKELPREVKVKLGMVKSYASTNAPEHHPPMELAVMPTVIYKSNYPEFYREIGWHPCRQLYCLSLSNETLIELKGKR